MSLLQSLESQLFAHKFLHSYQYQLTVSRSFILLTAGNCVDT